MSTVAPSIKANFGLADCRKAGTVAEQCCYKKHGLGKSQ